jgi:hypothetical protein
MLKTEQVGEFTVSEAGMREAVRRVLMVKRVRVEIDKGEMDEETTTAITIYPHIAGCITPQITINQFMQLPELLIDQLSEAAMRLNPHWFAVPDEEKKTSELPPTPTTDSTN